MPPLNDLQPAPLRDHYDVVVVGGGLAGCAAAIGLARHGASVLLAEQGTYPSHKLCGEFLSTESRGLLARLGVLGAVEQAGAEPITRAWMTAPGGADASLPLPGTALGLSRYRLDALLAGAARAVGAEVRERCPVLDVRAAAEGYSVSLPDAEVSARLVIGAHGKRSRLDGRLQRSFLRSPSPLVGFKAHFEGEAIPETIEMHAFRGGYCGLSPIEEGRVNVCWLAHADVLRSAGGTPDAMLRGPLSTNPHLARRLQALRRVSPRYEAVAQVTFQRKGLFDGGLCMIGDTAAMITPFCGDGMSMALQTAELVVPLATDHLNGRLDRAGFERAYERAWREQFSQRLRLGRLLHEAFVRPGGAEVLVRASRSAPRLAAWAIRQTRG